MSLAGLTPTTTRLRAGRASLVAQQPRQRLLVRAAAAPAAASSVAVKQSGLASLQGTSRKQNEDRAAVVVGQLEGLGG